MLKRALVRCLITVTCIGLWLGLGLVAEASPHAYAKTSRPVQCAAALQLMAMAAPDWAEKPGVVDSWSAWLDAAGAEAARTGDNALEAIDAEVAMMARVAVRKPDTLALFAADCATDQRVSQR